MARTFVEMRLAGFALVTLMLWNAAAGADASTPAAAAPDPAPVRVSAGSTAPQLTRAQADDLLSTLKDPDKRARFTATLEAYVQALPQTAAPANAMAAPHPAPPMTAPAAAAPAAPGRVIATMLQQASAQAAAAGGRLAGGFRAITDFPALSAWANKELAAPSARADLAGASGRLLIVMSVVVLGDALLRWTIRHRLADPDSTAPAPAMSANHLWPAIRRAGLQGFMLLLVALAGNAVLVLLLADWPVARSVAFGTVNGYVALRLLVTVADALLVARTPIRPRTKRIAVLLVLTIALGLIGGDVVTKFGAVPEVEDSFDKLTALIVHVLLILLVIQTRGTVSGWLRRTTAPLKGFAGLGDALAAVWPYVAVTALAGWWLVFAMDVPNAYHQILRFVVVTTAVLLAARVVGALVISGIDRRLALLSAADRHSIGARVAGYGGLVRGTARAALVLLTLAILLEAWGLPWRVWFDSGHAGYGVAAFILKMLLLAVIGILCWESADAAFEARVTRLTQSASLARATRLRTLQPIIRVALIIGLTLIIVMTALSELGINVGPLLAGAGILGVALGFGSQKLVQDFITGIFLLVEDAVDVGDWVTVAGLSGSVEHLSIRTIRLRAGDGSVHLIPFSSVTSVTNTNRGIGNAAVSVNIDPGEDTDKVGAILEEIAKEMRTDPAYSDAMQSDLQLWGVDKVDAAMTTIAGQIVCTDSGRWAVQREFNRRLKKRFEQEGIALGLPQQQVRIIKSAVTKGGG
jgi:small-conductance mechanosensitive channel